ncbi:MAG: hypothetical protein ABR936_13010 [Bacteroidota bacterium]|jgi:hypothetical protein
MQQYKSESLRRAGVPSRWINKLQHNGDKGSERDLSAAVEEGKVFLKVNSAAAPNKKNRGKLNRHPLGAKNL